MKKTVILFATILGLTFGFQISIAQTLAFTHHVLLEKNSSQARNIADFNNDGRGDIFVVEGEFKPTVFAWYEFPNWKKHTINSKSLAGMHYIADSAIGDVDGDGDQDLILPDAHEGMMRMLWFENPFIGGKSKDQEWQEHVMADLGDVSWLKDVEVADFNNDGMLDVAARGEHDMFMLYHQKNTWEKIHFPVKAHEGLASGDIDRDGYSDLILNGFWLKNPGKNIRSVWTEYDFDTKWFDQKTDSWQDNNCQVRIGDINADGLLDIIISNSEKAGYPVSWYQAPKDPMNETWREHVIDTLDYCHTLQIADFDNNGSLDVLAAEMVKGDDPDKMMLYLNNANIKSATVRKDATIAFTAQQIQNTGAYWAIAGDLGGDGDIDILSSHSYDEPPVEFWENHLLEQKKSLDKK